MKNFEKIILFALFLGWLGGFLVILVHGGDVSVLNPKGLVADKERNLMFFGTLLSLIIVIPVFALTFGIAWRYRESNKAAKYTPNWDHSRLLESIWWGVPTVLIVILSVITFKSSHDLDPFKPIQAAEKSLKIQVVALQWKWLFIYPEQNIATVNYVQFPKDRPINFEVSADAPMNSFWIPSLGGQIYAMSGMSTKLHLLAYDEGVYNGSSANISGRGFAGMNFKAESVDQAKFNAWVRVSQSQSKTLDFDAYESLAKPSENDPPSSYAPIEQNLYEKIIYQYVYIPPVNSGDKP